MGRKLNSNYDFERMEREMPNLEFLHFNCPHCTDDNGSFADIVLYIPKRDERKIASQCNCNGQEERCVVLLNLLQSYNIEKMLQGMSVILGSED